MSLTPGQLPGPNPGAGSGSSSASGDDGVGPWALALPAAGGIATPGVNLAGAGLLIFGSVVGGPLVPTAVGMAQCYSEGCGAGGWSLAGLPLLPKVPLSLAPSSTRNALLAVAKNQKVRNVINALYRRGATFGDGGTADAIREEIRTGVPIKGKFHFNKGLQQRANLIKLLRDASLDQGDREIVKRLLSDLQSALSSATK